MKHHDDLEMRENIVLDIKKNPSIKDTVQQMLMDKPIYSTDKGDKYLVQDVIKSKYGVYLPSSAIATISTILRARNILLSNKPYIDRRVENKGKYTRAKCNPINKDIEDT